MIENGIYVALGFLASGLLALLFLPAFWRRALRLSTRRLEMQLPLSMTEIVAERDQLRAEFALEQRRIEKHVEDLSVARARDMAELGRRATHIATLEAELVETWHQSELRAERLAALGADLINQQAELGVAHQLLWDAEGRLGVRTREFAALADQHRALADLAEERRGAIAALETRIIGHEADNAELGGALESLKRDHQELTRATLALEDKNAAARADAERATAARDQALSLVKDNVDRAQEFERQHRVERRARLRLESELATQTSALAAAEASQAALREAHAAEMAALRHAERELLQNVENLRAQNAALEGALAAARRDATNLRAERVANLPPHVDGEGETALLRRAIVDIGARVSQMVDRMEAPAPAAPANDDSAMARPLDAPRGETHVGAAE